MATVLINGEFFDSSEAQVSAFDAGLQHGVGLFETMTAGLAGGEARVVGLDEHVERLVGSAKALGMAESLAAPALAEAVTATVERAGHARARVRLTITGGDLNLLRAGARGHEPTVLVVAQPATEYPPEMYERGVRVVIADWRVNPLDEFAGHKTLNYWPRLRELQKAGAKQAAEALVFQVSNFLAGGCVSNCLFIRSGEVVTPIARGEEEEIAGPQFDPAGEAPGVPGQGAAMRSPVLPGIARRQVLAWAEAEGLSIARRMVSIDDVLSADEVVLTNSSWGVLPVVAAEQRAIAGGKVGPVARGWVERWRALI